MEPASPLRPYDPARHDSQVIALFDSEANAARARADVVAAGVAAERVTLVAHGAALEGGLAHPVQDLFVPEDDYHDYHHALGRGHTMLVVRPESAAARDAAVAALARAAPIDLEQHGRQRRAEAAPAGRMEVNHANLSRADMQGRAVGGRDETMLDMTGQEMPVRRMSEADMAEAPFAPRSTPEEPTAPLASPAAAEATAQSGSPAPQPARQASYTYGVPADIVARMSPEEQIMAQGGTFRRMKDGQTRAGWRETHPEAARVRSYVTERSSDAAS